MKLFFRVRHEPLSGGIFRGVKCNSLRCLRLLIGHLRSQQGPTNRYMICSFNYNTLTTNPIILIFSTLTYLHIQTVLYPASTNFCFNSSKTSSLFLSAFTFIDLYILFATGLVYLLKTSNLFFIVSVLSSDLPLVLPLSSSLSCITFSEHSK